MKLTVCRMSDFASFLHGLGTECVIGSNIGKVYISDARSQKRIEHSEIAWTSDRKASNHAPRLDTIRKKADKTIELGNRRITINDPKWDGPWAIGPREV